MVEDDFFGKTTSRNPGPSAWPPPSSTASTGVNVQDWEVGASGYAAVWARENTGGSPEAHPRGR